MVRGVAMTITEELPAASAAGFTAGSMPMMGSPGWSWRSRPMAALVAVLQATTIPLTPCASNPVHGGEGQGTDLVQGLFPIGGVGGIPEKEKIFLGQQAHAGAENADAAQTGVKDPDGTGLGFHIPSPSLLAGGWMRAIAVLRYYTTIFPAAP